MDLGRERAVPQSGCRHFVTDHESSSVRPQRAPKNAVKNSRGPAGVRDENQVV